MLINHYNNFEELFLHHPHNIHHNNNQNLVHIPPHPHQQGQINLILNQIIEGNNLLNNMLLQIQHHGHNFYQQVAAGNINFQLIFDNFQWLNNFYMQNNNLLNHINALNAELQAIMNQLNEGNGDHQQNQNNNQGKNYF